MIHSEERDGKTTFYVGGMISEDSEFSEIISSLSAEKDEVIIDLGSVERINSLGVRQWYNCIKALQNNNKNVLLERCPAVMVQQFNMISFTYVGCSVVSVLVPYFCDNCDCVKQHQINLKEHKADSVDETRTCNDCGQSMICEYLPDTYLAFRQKIEEDDKSERFNVH